ncbi:MAG: universal stress protein [Gammaproteobacteria bacterium]|nr:universal stress protein [Gammaproteobacteria bacterium]
MSYEANIKKVLVVLSPDLISPDKPKQSPLIHRAVSLAKNAGCELELFHVCYDSGLEYQLFRSSADLKRRREALADQDATVLADIAARLKSDGINVRHEVRWGNPRTDAILKKIVQSKPDIVLKQARERNYVLGLTSNTDWDLARRSPVHVWLVNEEVEHIDRIMAAIGNKFSDPGDITTAVDYDLLKVAGLVGDAFEAEIHSVNAYQVPELRDLVPGIEGTVAPVASIEEQHRLRTRIVSQHNSSVQALAQYFNIADDHVYVREGHPNKIIPQVAQSIGADMIVMGANSIGRLERLISSVTVEPVMAETHTDMLIVRERDLAVVPDIDERPIRGVPKYNLEHAITNPEESFTSPLEVANLSDVSVELRNRILQAWEYDIRAEMTEENEGGPPRGVDVNALDEIYSAKALLEMKQHKSGNRQGALHGASG